MNKNQRGISLIVLVITIIVIIILAAAVILTINNNNPMDNANKARYTSDRANVQNALSTAIGKIAADKQCSVTIPAQADIASGIGYSLNGASDGVTKGKIGWETLATVSSGEEATTILGMKMPTYGSNTRWFVNSNGEVSVQVAGVVYGPGGTNLQPGVPVNGNTNYTVDGKTAVIPNGFYISKVSTEQSIDGGLVVVAPDASEFVWVPVDNVDDMFSGTTGNFAGRLTAYSKNGDIGGTTIDPNYREPDIITGADNNAYDNDVANFAGRLTAYTKNGDKAGTTIDPNYREPDIITGEDKISHDNVVANLDIINRILGINFTTGDQLKTMMKDEVNAMYESIRINKGFYIGRYETGDLSKDQVVSNKDNSDISDKTWYEMYAKQKKYGTQLKTGVKSSMIYGSQWDAVMRWFGVDTNPEIHKYVTNAEGKGNWNNTSPLATGIYPVKNIYDMSGNVVDWTAEAISSNGRVYRGGCYLYDTAGQYAGRRDNYGPTVHNRNIGTRLALYL